MNRMGGLYYSRRYVYEIISRYRTRLLNFHTLHYLSPKSHQLRDYSDITFIKNIIYEKRIRINEGLLHKYSHIEHANKNVCHVTR